MTNFKKMMVRLRQKYGQLQYSAEFVESKHPREGDGTFAPIEGGVKGLLERAREKPHMTADDANALLEPDHIAQWDKWANGDVVGKISHRSTRRFIGQIKIKSNGTVELDDAAKRIYGEKLGYAPDATGETKEPKAKEFHGSWKKSSRGDDVAIVSAESVGLKKKRNFRVSDDGTIKVGDKLTVDGKEFTLQAIGRPFDTSSGQFVYLYPSKPSGSRDNRDEPPDDPIERMEWEQQKSRGKSGELPGA